MIAEEDPDGDGIVTKEEFTKMLERKKWLCSLLLYFTFNFIKYWTNKCLSIIKCVSLCKVKCAFNNRVLNAHKKYVAFITVKDYIHQYTGYVIKVIIITATVIIIYDNHHHHIRTAFSNIQNDPKDRTCLRHKLIGVRWELLQPLCSAASSIKKQQI